MKQEKVATDLVMHVLAAAERTGLITGDKTDRLSARVNHRLLEQAKKRTGIKSSTALVEFALASIALEDPFPEVFDKIKGTVDPDIKLGF
ncbi:hypothetical protein ACWGNA_20040 [Brucella cytisi]|jgi:hypothetical protein|uniref:Uncharacterized protein n=1 Tax=Brucella cytisi TaxID=407152 RepID=A0A1J6ICI5_9HYPH|nr:hypothetical protein [Brucella cytisi]OIS92768.1 hypothetical protein BLA27_15165 [Brucella cytisi]